MTVAVGVVALPRVLGQNDTRARRLTSLVERPQDLVITTLLGTNVADYLATVCVTALLLRAAEAQNLAGIYATAILTPLILVFGGVMPKDWFQRESVLEWRRPSRLWRPSKANPHWRLKKAFA